MENNPQNDPGMTSQAIYQITVKGKLDEHWADWFSGTTIPMTYSSDVLPNTILTLQLRDQSELLGLLSQLHGFNLLILQVILTGNEGGNYVVNG